MMSRINAIADELAKKFQARIDNGQLLEVVEDDPDRDQMFTLEDYILRGTTSIDGLIKICDKVLKQLGGKGPVDGYNQFRIEGVWAQLFIGTEKEKASDEIQIIVKMMYKKQ